MKWPLHVLTLEVRKTLSYRVDFWVNFVGSIGVHVGVAYFLWKSVFEFNNITELGGYTFDSLIFYYFLIPFIVRVTHAQDESGISREIYDGSFNKYLIYPIDVITYKFMSHVGYAAVTALQMCLGLLIVIPFFGMPADVHIGASSIALFIPLAFLSSYLVFIMMFSIELVAFWADTVWSLVVMLRLTIQMFGGMLIPVEMFPAPLRAANDLLPFQFGASLPLRCLMGKLTTSEIFNAYLLGIAWAVIGTLIAYGILKKGLRNYTGVGI